MSVQLVGVLEDEPRRVGGTCTLTLAAAAQCWTVLVSSAHAQWILRTFEAGWLVQVVGALAAPGVLHAVLVWPVEAPLD